MPGERAAVGLSGGGDSVALLLLLKEWAEANAAPAPAALVVDHGLRPESAKEASEVATWARGIGVHAEILRWRGKRQGNLEDAAREGRYRLMGAWCGANACRVLLVGHTQDDQAETFLLRLGRGSGVDGLAAMQAHAPFPVPNHPGLTLGRPLLSFSRAELRNYLKVQGVPWREDPMNEDPRFARVRVRALLPLLEEAGLPPARIAAAAAHLARARAALDAKTAAFLRKHARIRDGFALIDRAALCRAPEEIGLRALAQLLMQVSGAVYRPRFERLQRLYADLTGPDAPRGRTLHGCRIALAPKSFRELGEQSLIIRGEAARKALGPLLFASETAHCEARLSALTVS